MLSVESLPADVAEVLLDLEQVGDLSRPLEQLQQPLLLALEVASAGGEVNIFLGHLLSADVSLQHLAEGRDLGYHIVQVRRRHADRHVRPRRAVLGTQARVGQVPVGLAGDPDDLLMGLLHILDPHPQAAGADEHGRRRGLKGEADVGPMSKPLPGIDSSGASAGMPAGPPRPRPPPPKPPPALRAASCSAARRSISSTAYAERAGALRADSRLRLNTGKIIAKKIRMPSRAAKSQYSRIDFFRLPSGGVDIAAASLERRFGAGRDEHWGGA
jgi:hypothetical protein